VVRVAATTAITRLIISLTIRLIGFLSKNYLAHGAQA
jgi:hypothetical protein